MFLRNSAAACVYVKLSIKHAVNGRYTLLVPTAHWHGCHFGHLYRQAVFTALIHATREPAMLSRDFVAQLYRVTKLQQETVHVAHCSFVL